MENLNNKWLLLDLIYYKDEYQEINKLNLLHPDDVEPFKICKSFSLCECIKDEDEYLTVKNKSYLFRIKKEAIKQIMPTPKFTWNDLVYQKSKPEFTASIEDLFWHYKDEKYFYQISISGKIKSNRYSDKDLELVKHQ